MTRIHKVVVYFDQLLGVAPTRKLIGILFLPFSDFKKFQLFLPLSSFFDRKEKDTKSAFQVVSVHFYPFV